MKKEIQEELARLTAKLGELGKGASPAELKEICGRIYERLCILDYLESQIAGKPQTSESVSFDSKSFREQNWFVEPEPVPRPEHQEELVEPLMEKIKDIVAQMPEESQQVDALLERVLPSGRQGQTRIEEIASEYQQMPVFERKEPLDSEELKPSSINETGSQPRSINEQISIGIKIGLNDRHAFVNQLFGGSSEAYQETLSRVATMDSFTEVQIFIQERVKRQFDNWEGKEEFEQRFMSLLERGFN